MRATRPGRKVHGFPLVQLQAADSSGRIQCFQNTPQQGNESCRLLVTGAGNFVGALDATLEVQIIHRLRDLQHSMGCSILFISHHLGVIAELCDSVVVMYGGEVVERGSVRDIFHRPSHPYTGKLLECDPARIAETTRSLPTIPGEIPDLANLPRGCIFADRCDKSVDLCRDHNPPDREIEVDHWARCHLAGDPAT